MSNTKTEESKMITITNVRNHHGRICAPDVRQVPPHKALRSLVYYELGYGGNITELEDTKITVVTNVVGCIDTVTFSADTPETIRSLIEIAVLHIYLGKQHGQKIVEQLAETLTKGQDLTALVITTSAPILYGKSLIRMVLTAFLGKKKIEEVLSLLERPLDELLTFAEIKVELGDEALEEALTKF